MRIKGKDERNAPLVHQIICRDAKLAAHLCAVRNEVVVLCTRYIYLLVLPFQKREGKNGNKYGTGWWSVYRNTGAGGYWWLYCVCERPDGVASAGHPHQSTSVKNICNCHKNNGAGFLCSCACQQSLWERHHSAHAHHCCGNANTEYARGRMGPWTGKRQPLLCFSFSGKKKAGKKCAEMADTAAPMTLFANSDPTCVYATAEVEGAMYLELIPKERFHCRRIRRISN